MTTIFFQKQGKLYLKPARILLITKIFWKFFRQFLKFPLNFSWNFLKFFQKQSSVNIFIICTNLSKYVKTVFNTLLNFMELLNISKIFRKASRKYQ